MSALPRQIRQCRSLLLPLRLLSVSSGPTPTALPRYYSSKARPWVPASKRLIIDRDGNIVPLYDQSDEVHVNTYDSADDLGKFDEEPVLNEGEDPDEELTDAGQLEYKALNKILEVEEGTTTTADLYAKAKGLLEDNDADIPIDDDIAEFFKHDLGDDENGEPIQAYQLYDEAAREDGIRPIPNSPAFYTGRYRYFDVLSQLRTSIGQARATLKTLQLLPLPEFARESLLPLPPVWKDSQGMSDSIGMVLNTARHRRLIALLNELNELLQIATTAGCTELADMLDGIVSMFEKGEDAKKAVLARGQIKTVELDQFGRSYTLGRRKTSSARVWMIPVEKGQVRTPYESVNLARLQQEHEDSQRVEEPEPQSDATSSNTRSLDAAVEPVQKEDSTDLETALATDVDTIAKPKTPLPPPVRKVNIPVTTILINNIPINQYFPNNLDRERVLYPLKITGVLGKFNIFTIARGGGHTGQTGAIAHGIAKGIIAHDIKLHQILKKADLIKRDPRMVERKKTGRPSARTAYRWTKR